jgi:hypothetical protein
MLVCSRNEDERKRNGLPFDLSEPKSVTSKYSLSKILKRKRKQDNLSQ